MVLEKPKLFTTKQEFVITMLLLALVVVVRLGWVYHDYHRFVAQPFVYTHATIVNTYPKTRNGKTYAVLKLHTDSQKTIYTTSYRQDLKRGQRIYLQLLPNERIGFWEYLGGMYCKSRIKRVDPPTANGQRLLESWINRQHADPNMQAFYRAIFLATPIPKTLRTQIASLGVSHLVALSGFHLGILWGILYGLGLLIYRPFQRRYFPWRHALADVGLAVMVVLGGYLWLTGFPPSLLRSYAMLLVGWGLVLMGIELVSFPFLATITLTLLALFPSLIASLGFWLSIAGVFYIFLVLRYCQGMHARWISLLCIPLGIFILMQPLVHGIFPLTTPYQLLSPLLSVGFILFYPLSFLLHLVGQGGVLDGVLTTLFSMPETMREHLLPGWAVVGYILLSLLAIYRRWLMGVLLMVAVGYVGYLFW